APRAASVERGPIPRMRLRATASAALGIALFAGAPSSRADGAPDEPSAKPAPAATETAAASAGATKAASESQPSDGQPKPLAFDDFLVLDTGRMPFHPRDPHGLSVELHGEYELRVRAMTTLRLDAPVSAPQANTLGQNVYLYHWLRLNARVDYRDRLA